MERKQANQNVSIDVSRDVSHSANSNNLGNKQMASVTTLFALFATFMKYRVSMFIAKRKSSKTTFPGYIAISNFSTIPLSTRYQWQFSPFSGPTPIVIINFHKWDRTIPNFWFDNILLYKLNSTRVKKGRKNYSNWLCLTPIFQDFLLYKSPMRQLSFNQLLSPSRSILHTLAPVSILWKFQPRYCGRI